MKVQYAPVSVITDNVINWILGCFSSSNCLKLASFNGKGISDKVNIWLLLSEIGWPTVITLSGAQCITIHALYNKKYYRTLKICGKKMTRVLDLSIDHNIFFSGNNIVRRKQKNKRNFTFVDPDICDGIFRRKKVIVLFLPEREKKMV